MSRNLIDQLDAAGVEVPKPTRKLGGHRLHERIISALTLNNANYIKCPVLMILVIGLILYFNFTYRWNFVETLAPCFLAAYLGSRLWNTDIKSGKFVVSTGRHILFFTLCVAISGSVTIIYLTTSPVATLYMEVAAVIFVVSTTAIGIPRTHRVLAGLVLVCLVSLLAMTAIEMGPDGHLNMVVQSLEAGRATPSKPSVAGGGHAARGAVFFLAMAFAMAGAGISFLAPGKEEASVATTPHLDELTGARSRKWVLDELAVMIATGTGGWLMLLDIDRFARINNTLGFEVGDKMLRIVAQRGALIPGASGSCARIGADVFALVLSEDVDINEIHRLMSADVELPCCGRTIALTMCVGARRIESKWSAMDTLRGAGLALQIAKSGGRGRLHVCIPKNCIGLLSELDMEIDLRAALAGSEFVIHYQPIVRMSDRELAGFEALLRWRHPEKGIIPPNEFIPVLEQTGLIIPVGAWVLKEAASTLRALQVAGASKLPLFMSVNVSPAQLRYPDVLRSAVLEAVDLCGPRLKLEVTESMIIDDPEAAAIELASLRKLGADLSLDDFGTGHSSLSVLHRLPFQTLKLDRSILRGLHDHRTQTMIKALINMANDLDLAVVAEGIEKDSDADTLSAMGCTYGQGYWFGRPLPMDEQGDFARFLRPGGAVGGYS